MPQGLPQKLVAPSKPAPLDQPQAPKDRVELTSNSVYQHTEECHGVEAPAETAWHNVNPVKRRPQQLGPPPSCGPRSCIVEDDAEALEDLTANTQASFLETAPALTDCG